MRAPLAPSAPLEDLPLLRSPDVLLAQLARDPAGAPDCAACARGDPRAQLALLALLAPERTPTTRRAAWELFLHLFTRSAAARALLARARATPGEVACRVLEASHDLVAVGARGFDPARGELFGWFAAGVRGRLTGARRAAHRHADLRRRGAGEGALRTEAPAEHGPEGVVLARERADLEEALAERVRCVLFDWAARDTSMTAAQRPVVRAALARGWIGLRLEPGEARAIAARCGVTPGGVSTTLWRVRASLYARLRADPLVRRLWAEVSGEPT